MAKQRHVIEREIRERVRNFIADRANIDPETIRSKDVIRQLFGASFDVKAFLADLFQIEPVHLAPEFYLGRPLHPFDPSMTAQDLTYMIVLAYHREGWAVRRVKGDVDDDPGPRIVG